METITMTTDDKVMFSTMLTSLGLVFNTSITEMLLQVYWMALTDLPITALRHACAQVVKWDREFPVPVVLRDYARDWMEKQKYEAPASTEQLLQLREELVSPEEVKALIASIWPNGETPAPPPIPRPRARRPPDALHYEPTGDAEITKAQLRAQLAWLEREGEERP
jgi:hypothetical protein